jgi:transposase
VEALRRLLRGEYDVHPDGFEVESGKVVGVMYMLREVMNRLGLGRAIGYSREAKLVQFLICARVAVQGSRLSAVRWAKNHAVEEILGVGEFDEDDLYRALDWLCKEQERIEQALYRRYIANRGARPVLVLYDVTSSYFEGMHNELGEYGYNRDGKRGKKQIVIGLLADIEGEPLAVRVFRGNTNDVSTIGEEIRVLQEEFGVQEVVFIGDRGMIKSKGKVLLAGQGYSYITALTNPQIMKLLRTGKIQLEMFDNEVYEVLLDGRRYILCRNNAVRQKEESRRESKLCRLRALLEKNNVYLAEHPRATGKTQVKNLGQWIMRHKLQSFVTVSLEGREIAITVNAASRERDALLDGCYVLETPVVPQRMTTQQVNQSYRSLQRVERDFRTVKTGLLKVRPIFLRKGNRTQAHVFITMLALMVSRDVERRIAPIRERDRAFTVADAVESLARLTFIRFLSPTTEIEKLPRPDQEQRSILEALEITLPGKLTM